MQRIITLNQDTLTSGRTRSKWTQTGGLWDSAKGLNPFIESDLYRGLVACTASPTDMTASVIVDTPMAHVVDQRASINNLYILGDGGNLYSVDVINTVTNHRSSSNVINGASNGMAIMQPAGGTAKLLYAREARIGTWDMSGVYPTGWDDVAFNPGTTTEHRPMHKFAGVTYFGNKNYVGYIYDNAGTLTQVAQGLSLDELEVCTAISDDGRYVVAGVSQPVDESYATNTSCRVVFWNGGTDEVIWQVRVHNESSIRAIFNEGGVTHVVGSRGVYVVQLGIADAQTIYRFDSDEAIPYDGTNYGSPNCIAPFYDGFIFGAIGTAITKPDSAVNKKYVYNPLQGLTGDASLYVSDFKSNNIYVGTRSDKLYRFNLASAGNTSETWITRNIDLGGEWHVKRIKITLPNGVGGSDALDVTVIGDDGDSSATTKTITQATCGDKHRLSLTLDKQVTTTHLKLSFAPNAGIPSFSNIEIWGEPSTT